MSKKETCDYSIKTPDGIVFCCTNDRGHSGDHSHTIASNDGRFIYISWVQTWEEYNEAKTALATVSQEPIKG